MRFRLCLVLFVLATIFAVSIKANVVYNREEHLLLDNRQLADIFTRKQKYWEDGTKITVYIKPINSIEHKAFVVEWLQISHNSYRTKVDHEVYSGNNSGLIEVKSDEEMLIKVANTANSIGYIDNKLLLRGEKNVKVISIPN